jgi:hypothetical protein
VPKIGGSLRVLNVDDRVLSNQVPTAAKNAIAQGPISGLDHSFTNEKKTFLYGICLTSSNTFMIYHRYKLTFYAADETGEAEFFCFDSVAKRIVGKSCESLLQSMDPSGSEPPDLDAIVGLKFTFAINININSFYSAEKIFNIDSILETYGRKQLDPSVEQAYRYQEPLMLDEHSVPSMQDSPATAMERLSTDFGSPVVSTVIRL